MVYAVFLLLAAPLVILAVHDQLTRRRERRRIERSKERQQRRVREWGLMEGVRDRCGNLGITCQPDDARDQS